MKNIPLALKGASPKRTYAKPVLLKIGSVKKLTQKGGSQADIFTNYTA